MPFNLIIHCFPPPHPRLVFVFVTWLHIHEHSPTFNADGHRFNHEIQHRINSAKVIQLHVTGLGWLMIFVWVIFQYRLISFKLSHGILNAIDLKWKIGLHSERRREREIENVMHAHGGRFSVCHDICQLSPAKSGPI